MHTRVKLLLLILIALMFAATLAIGQEETPSVIEQFAQTATALIQARTGTPAPLTAEATLEMTEETTVEPTEAPVEHTEAVTAEATETVTVEATEVATEEAVVAEPTEEATPEPTEMPAEGEDTTIRGIPLFFLLFGAVMVLLIGTVVLIQENPRPMDDEE
jgi:hypothetical protein